MSTLNLGIPDARKDDAAEALFRARRGIRSLILRTVVWTVVIVGVSVFGLLRYQSGQMEQWVTTSYGAAVDRLHAMTAERFELGTVTGLARTNHAAIVAATGLPRTASFLELDTAELQQAITALPWVAEAVVEIQAHHRIGVHVIEEEVAAIWREGENSWLVNAHGALIDLAGPKPTPRHVPVLVGRGAPAAVGEVLALRVAYPALTNEFGQFYRVGERRWDGVLYDGTVVMFPEGNLMAVVDQFVAANRQAGLLEQGVARIDLRIPNVIAVRYQGEALERFLDAQRREPDGQGA